MKQAEWNGTRSVLLALLGLVGFTSSASGQTDYFNTDRHRPITVEDAYAVERYSFELQMAPIWLERLRDAYQWGIEPELAWGFLPRTQFEIGLAYTVLDSGRTATGDVAGLNLSLLHNLNAETRGLPALGLGLDVILPVGGAAPETALGTVRALLTRSLSFARFHLNADYTLGDAGATGDAENIDASRWLAGLAIDRTFPLKSMLITAEVVASQPLDETDDLEWRAAGGLRYQVSPRYALDAGVGRRMTGPDPAWFFTFGTAYAFAIRSFMSSARR